VIKKNLILTILHKYNYPVVEPFIKSLKQTGYQDDLVIFISEATSKTTKKILKKQGAILVEFKNSYPFINGYNGVFEDIAPSITLNNYRFLFYLKYITENAGQYENIMLTDIRDVVFQKNIFDGIEDNKIYFFLEDASEVFRSSAMNYDWCLYANGHEITEKIIDKNVSCAGIVIGGYKPIMDYLIYMQSRFKFRPDLRWGLDQGVHNEYVYTVVNNDAIIVPNTFPLLLTLGACRNFKQGPDGNLTNERNEAYWVVHQYDRFGDLIVYFKKKYIGNRFVQRFKKALFTILP